MGARGVWKGMWRGDGAERRVHGESIIMGELSSWGAAKTKAANSNEESDPKDNPAGTPTKS